MKKMEAAAVYWDSSSILSALFADSHSEKALAMASREGVHFISTLGYAEVSAIIHRLRREKLLSDVLFELAQETLKTGPWRRLNIWPEWEKLYALASKWPLKGASLWHLALVKTIQKHLPEIALFTFHGPLRKAAEEEGLLA